MYVQVLNDLIENVSYFALPLENLDRSFQKQILFNILCKKREKKLATG
jgi:hypothetical protein